MAGVNNELVGRINKIAQRLIKQEHPGAATIIPKLKKIKDFIEKGGVIGPADFRFINSYDLEILPPCRFLSPLWECKLGLMEYCSHRAEWEKGKCTCRKYEGRKK